MQAQKDELSPEAAEFLLAIDFGESDRERMLQLAEREVKRSTTPVENEDESPFQTRHLLLEIRP